MHVTRIWSCGMASSCAACDARHVFSCAVLLPAPFGASDGESPVTPPRELRRGGQYAGQPRKRGAPRRRLDNLCWTTNSVTVSNSISRVYGITITAINQNCVCALLSVCAARTTATVHVAASALLHTEQVSTIHVHAPLVGPGVAILRSQRASQAANSAGSVAGTAPGSADASAT